MPLSKLIYKHLISYLEHQFPDNMSEGASFQSSKVAPSLLFLDTATILGSFTIRPCYSTGTEKFFHDPTEESNKS